MFHKFVGLIRGPIFGRTARPKRGDGKYVRQLLADVLSVPFFGPRAGDQTGTAQDLESESGGLVPCSQWGLPVRRVVVDLSLLGSLLHSLLLGLLDRLLNGTVALDCDRFDL